MQLLILCLIIIKNNRVSITSWQLRHTNESLLASLSSVPNLENSIRSAVNKFLFPEAIWLISRVQFSLNNRPYLTTRGHFRSQLSTPLYASQSPNISKANIFIVYEVKEHSQSVGILKLSNIFMIITVGKSQNNSGEITFWTYK